MEIIAHRGAAYEAPENSLAAFELAIVQGADRIELDVQLTRDGHAVVLHDPSTERLGDRRIEVEFSSLEEVRSVRLSNGERIPTLDEACEVAKGRCLLDVEIKATGSGVPAEIQRVLRRHGLERDTLVTSFDAPTLRALHGLGWGGRIGLLIGSRSLNLRQRAYEAWPLAALETARAHELVIHHQLIHRPLRQALARRRIGLMLWTAMEDEARPPESRRLLYEKLAGAGAGGIIVARVAECRETVGAVNRFGGHSPG